MAKCAETNTAEDCGKAGDSWSYFYSYFLNNSDANPYDVRYPITTMLTYPSPDYNFYLKRESVAKAIGAKVKYTECSVETNNPFILTMADEYVYVCLTFHKKNFQTKF